MAGNKFKPLSPIALAIHTVDETIRDLRLKRQELVALLPKRRGAKKPDTIMTHPITGKKSCYVKAGKRYAERQRKKTSIDYAQTSEIADNPDYYEATNPFLDQDPSQSDVNLYFACSVATQILVAWLLPDKWRKAWLGAWIGVSGINVLHNYRIGVRF